MLSDENTERLIDAMLEETLGGVTPPDLSARILAAWEQRQAELKLQGTASGPPFSAFDHRPSGPTPFPPPLVLDDRLHTVVDPSRRISRRGARRPSHRWSLLPVSLTAAAAILLLLGYGVYRATDSQAPQVAQGNIPQAKPVPRLKQAPAIAARPRPATPPASESESESESHAQAPPAAEALVPALEPEKVAGTPFPFDPLPNEVPPPESRLPARDPRPDAELVALINEQLRAAWQSHSIAPSPAATDAQWCRRTFLRIVGRIPTVEELRSFTDDRSSDRYARLVDRLLTQAPYTEEYAQHWSEVWANVLLGRAPQEGTRREGLEQYLRDALAKNKPYDRMATELIAATGSGRPGADNFNGATNFLLAHATDDAALATARTSRVFLGVQLQCVQCHDHPTAPLPQSSFWAMNAFFRQMKVTGNRNDGQELVDHDYLGFDGRNEEGDVFFERPNGVLKVASPAFIDGTPLAIRSGRVSDVNRRQALAQMVVGSEYFRQAAVNRLWSHFLGYGFTRPVDDMVAPNEASHPEVLAALAEEFAVRGYDLKSVMRWIALSDSFNRSSRITASQLADMPEAGTAPLFSRYYTRQLPAEEVFRSLQIAAQLRGDAGAGGNIEQARLDWMASVQKSWQQKSAGDDEAGLEPAVVKLNASLVRYATTPALGNMLHTVSRANLKFEEKVEHLFLAALSRKPTPQERELAEKLAGINRQNEATALEDIWWALLNSNEFIFDH